MNYSNKENGFIKIYRSLFKHVFWKEKREYSKFEAWLWMLIHARYIEEPEYLEEAKDYVYRGELFGAERFLQNKFGWKSKKKVHEFLKLLVNYKMIERRGSIITLKNYRFYNPNFEINEEPGAEPGTEPGTEPHEEPGNLSKNNTIVELWNRYKNWGKNHNENHSMNQTKESFKNEIKKQSSNKYVMAVDKSERKLDLDNPISIMLRIWERKPFNETEKQLLFQTWKAIDKNPYVLVQAFRSSVFYSVYNLAYVHSAAVKIMNEFASKKVEGMSRNNKQKYAFRNDEIDPEMLEVLTELVNHFKTGKEN